MFYLIAPPSDLMWNDLDHTMVEKAVAEHNVDLGRLDWQPASEHTMSRDVLRAALAHGIACSRGIALHPFVMLDVTGADKRRLAMAEYQGMAPTIRDMDKRAEEQMKFMHAVETGQELTEPLGWVEEGERLHTEILAGMEESLAEAEAKAREVLSAPIKPELEEHWRGMGGVSL